MQPMNEAGMPPSTGQDSPVVSTNLPKEVAWAQNAQKLISISIPFRFLFFLFVIPAMFAVAVWMHFYLIVAIVVIALVISNFFERVTRLLDRFPGLRNVKVLGKALGFALSTRDFYQEHKPNWFLFYIVYPIAAPIAAIFSPTARKELKLWAKAFVLVISGDLINIALTYKSIYPPYLGMKDATQIAITHLFLAFFFSVFCMMPVATTAFTLSLAKRGRSLGILSLMSLVLCGVFSYVVVTKNKENISLVSTSLVALRMHKAPFRKELAITSEVILTYLQVRTPQQLKADFKEGVVASVPLATKKFRDMINHDAIRDEPKAFEVFALRFAPGPGNMVYGVHYANNKNHYALFVMDEKAQLYWSMAKLPPEFAKYLKLAFTAALARSNGHVFVEKMADDFPNK